MRYKTLLLVLVVATLAGCGSVREVHTNDTSAIEASRVNSATRGKLVRVHLRDGSKAYAVGVHVAPDTTSWLDPAKATYIAVPTSDVGKVTLMRAGQGALVGLGTGIVLGVGTGILRAQLEGDDPVNQFPSKTTSEKMTTLPLAHTAYASLITAPLGAIIGRKNTYRFVQD
ncbi:MAG TPA: hypothetical protein VF190_08665 [Rhodothermales bacterium]